MEKIKQDLKEASLRDDQMSSMIESMQQDILEALEKNSKEKS